jgi:hypothetical protein
METGSYNVRPPPKVGTTLLCAEQSEGRIPTALCQLFLIPEDGATVIPSPQSRPVSYWDLADRNHLVNSGIAHLP